MKLRLPLGLLRRWPIALAALVMAAIVHICTAIALPYFYRGDAYTRLARTLPANSFVILPQAKPKAQVLPFQLPDARYAICKFDIATGPLTVKAVLPEPGWTLSAYTTTGEGFYAFPASEQRRLTVNLLFLPPGERFLGAITDTRTLEPDTSQITAPSARGLIVIRAPLKGRTFATMIEEDMAQATCRRHRF